MLEADALVRLQSYTSYSEDPVLTSAELTFLLADNRIADNDGRFPEDDNWEGAWNLAQAAAEGWAIKAGKASNRFGFGSDVSRFDRQHVHDHCMKMSEYWAGQGGIVSIQVGDAYVYDPVIGNLNGGN